MCSGALENSNNLMLNVRFVASLFLSIWKRCWPYELQLTGALRRTNDWWCIVTWASRNPDIICLDTNQNKKFTWSWNDAPLTSPRFINFNIFHAAGFFHEWLHIYGGEAKAAYYLFSCWYCRNKFPGRLQQI